jgi:hypothetical protein
MAEMAIRIVINGPPSLYGGGTTSASRLKRFLNEGGHADSHFDRNQNPKCDDLRYRLILQFECARGQQAVQSKRFFNITY